MLVYYFVCFRGILKCVVWCVKVETLYIVMCCCLVCYKGLAMMCCLVCYKGLTVTCCLVSGVL